MSSDTMILTRKVQLIINSDDAAFIGEAYKTLYQWQYICFRSANYIFTHLFIQEQLQDPVLPQRRDKSKAGGCG